MGKEPGKDEVSGKFQSINCTTHCHSSRLKGQLLYPNITLWALGSGAGGCNLSGHGAPVRPKASLQRWRWGQQGAASNQYSWQLAGGCTAWERGGGGAPAASPALGILHLQCSSESHGELLKTNDWVPAPEFLIQ